MNSTTGDRRVPLPWILLISAGLQAAGLLVFLAVEPLRKSTLAADAATRDVQAVDREAAERLRKVEDQRRQQREQAPMKRADAEYLARKVEQERAAEITDQLRALQDIRKELALDEAVLREALAARTTEDVSNYLYDRLEPLLTQLVVHADAQHTELPLPAAPAVQAAAQNLRDLAVRERDRLLQEDVFEQLRAAHRGVQKTQRQFIEQLDVAQAAYAQDEDRIRRENHTEFLVNLARDQIAGLLGEFATLDMATMNDLPPDYEIPGARPPEGVDQLGTLSVPELHEQAQAIFADIQQFFAGTRAASLAIEQHTAMTSAYASIHVPAPAFSPGAVTDPPQTVGQLNHYADQLAQAAREVNQMWQQAHTMGAAGRAMAGRGDSAPHDGGPPGAAGRGRASGSMGAGAARAAEGRAGRYADMTPFLYVGGGAGERGFGSGNAGGRDITTESIRSGYAESGAGTPGAKGPPLLSEQKVIKEALPGRKFSRNSPRTGWLYIDTWYVIGPWDNHSRVGFDQAWPPETLIDLDATYKGKGDRPLRWQFHQSDNIRIKPPAEEESATYYAYTEVFFEEETEMLVAVASDDAAKVWVNDQLIWRDDGIGPWRLDEGFRKVVFKKGFNTLLVRIENGPITCTYSILLCPPEVLMSNSPFPTG